MMAADSDGCGVVTTVVTCEGDLSDPSFTGRFELVLGKLRNLLGEALKVRKLEPWNSVRVTLSIPREAALRLRQLATDGSQQLRALGILSVQVEGDQVISLRLAGSVATEPQEIILQTGQDGSATSSGSSAETNLSQLLTGNAQVPEPPTVPGEKVQFRSPNVVCPPDTIVPKVPKSNTSTSTTPPSTKAYVGPFPFTSMNQAMHSRDNLGTSTNYNTPPPPPYPGKHPSVNISSPLLVNLLQTEGAPSPKQNSAAVETDGTQSVLTTSNSVTVSPVFSQGSPTVKVNSKTTQGAFVLQKNVVSVPSTLRTVKSSFYPQVNSLHSVVPNVNMSHSNNALNKSIISQSPPTSNSSLIQSKQAASGGTNPQAKVLNTNNINNSTTQNNVLMSTSAFRQNIGVNSLNLKSQASPISVHNPPKSHDSLLSNMQSLNPSSSSSSASSNVQSAKPTTNNIRVVPYRSYPPPYPTQHQWEQSIQQMPQLQELTPTLTDLKTDLDHLLPGLEQDLVRSPPEIPEELTSVRGRPTYLINPLTGELEPQSCNESDEDEPGDVFRGLPSPSTLSDEDTNSTTRPDTTDQSDSESRSCHSDSGKHMRFKRNREKGRDSPNLKQEKIKLRLKLEKSEPVSPAYKVDVSFINTQPKKAVPGEELRVPPLHISLRGRNAVINNKKKIKLNPDGTPIKPKARKIQDHLKPKKDLLNNEHHLVSESESVLTTLVTTDQPKGEIDSKKIKKPKLNHDHRDNKSSSELMMGMELSKHDIPVYNSHFKEKLKERRGSDSELARSNNKKYAESNGILSSDKKRRLSQTEESQSSVLGSTNIGTVSSLSAHKPRKDKFKFKEGFKNKDLNRYKTYSKNIAEKLAKQVTLPVGDMDMEAKFKQRLMEEPDRIAPRLLPHRTEIENEAGKAVDLIHTLSDPPALKEKPPESDKCNTPDRKPDLSEKQAGRSPNSGAQGEDSGIESMDALSEKSPNQASQSPHADMPDSLKPKTQVPDMLDIEAQLAKMEGFTGEDLNENHNNQTKEQCCGLNSVLQDGVTTTVLKEQLPQVEVSLVPLKSKDDLDPLPVRVTPPLYTYSNPDKGRGSESPSLSDSDNSNPPGSMVKSKSLLEQLLIDIPENQTPSSPSPAARSVRTRASSKLNSPELNSPVVAKQVRAPPSTKRKRNESDSSSNSVEDLRNKKPRKCTENAAELIKACIGVEPPIKTKKKVSEESSDSDEPLIEVAGKVRKNSQINAATPRAKLKLNSNGSGGVGGGGGGGCGVGGVVVGGPGIIKTLPVNTRRSVRAIPALNTRSKGDKSQPDVDILRRKTRSAVSEGEGKRRKDVK